MKRLLVLGLVSCGSVSGVSIDATPTATVTVTKGGTGTGTVTSTPAGINCGTSCSGSFSGSVVLTATPDAGSTFTGWSGGTCSGTGTCSLSPTSNVAITATFDLPTPQMLTVTKSGDGTGTVTSSIGGINCGTTCTGVVDPSAQVVLTATPDVGFGFQGWTGGGCSGTAPCTVTVATATTVDAKFKAVIYLIDDSNDSLYKLTSLTPPTLTLVGALGVQYEFGDCAYDSANQKLYFVDGRPAAPTKSLYTVNLTTGAATLVGVHNLTDIFALGYDAQNNTLYAAGGSGTYMLYTMNITNGAPTAVGATTYTNGLAWDSKRNQMVAITSSGTFNTINLTTGTQTAIAGAGAVLGNNNGITYDAADDRFWMATYSTGVGIEKFDPNANYAGTAYTTTGSHTCIAYIP